MKSVLVVAGSDSGGGAGIQADLKALASLGVHGCTAITCVTAQNTQGVTSTLALPLDLIRDQIRAVLEDIDVSAVKTGMLYSEDIVKLVAKELKGFELPIVVDPVMVATAGSSLAQEGFVEALRRHLLPMTTLVTPNLNEGEALSGRRIRNVEDMKEAARDISRLGPPAVLMKGGHLKGDLVDVLLHEGEFHLFRGYRYPRELHGSGCTYASTIAGYLALGLDVTEAVRQARRKVAAGFETSYGVGRGFEVINSGYVDDRWGVWSSVSEAVHELIRFLPANLVPEVGINIGYALPGAQAPADVCAIQGRIVRYGGRVVAVGPPAFGASRHVARIILTAMRFDPSYRSAMNIRYADELVEGFRKSGLQAAAFDRSQEPEDVSTMEWGTEEAIRSVGRVPDIIYDLGGQGKVAMIRILGRNPSEVMEKLRRVVP